MAVQGVCNTRFLILTSVLLSSSSDKAKAELIFAIYSSSATRMIDIDNLLQIVSDGFMISVKSTRHLILKQEKFLAVRKYTEKLAQCREIYIRSILDIMMEHESSFDRSMFIDKFVNKFSYLMKANSIRVIVHHLYKSNKAR